VFAIPVEKLIRSIMSTAWMKFPGYERETAKALLEDYVQMLRGLGMKEEKVIDCMENRILRGTMLAEDWEDWVEKMKELVG
jgi:hypothetical protein